MPAACFKAWNGAAGGLTTGPLTAQASGATSGTARTMLQIAPASTTPIRVIEWGYSLVTAPANNVIMELIDTGTVFASGLTALTSAGIEKWNVPSGSASTVQLGAALSAYSAGSSTEGSISPSRLIDCQYENGLYYSKMYPLGREPEIPAGNALRIRATPTSAAGVSLLCWIVWEE